MDASLIFVKLHVVFHPWTRLTVLSWSLQLKDLVLQLLEKQRLSHGEVRAFGTPRRLVVWLLFFAITCILNNNKSDLLGKKRILVENIFYFKFIFSFLLSGACSLWDSRVPAPFSFLVFVCKHMPTGMRVLATRANFFL